MSSLQSFISNPFNFHLFHLVLSIKSIILKFHQSNYVIQFLWLSSHIGIHGNKVTDNLAKSTSNLTCPALTQLRHTDFVPILRCHISNLWSTYWSNLPAEFATRYKNIVPNIQNKICFNNLNSPRSTIIQFNRLRTGHTLLPAHAYKLGLNDSPLCTLHFNKKVCDLPHFLFDCPSLHEKRFILLIL